MKANIQFSLVVFAPVLIGLLLPVSILLPAGVILILITALDPAVSASSALSYWAWVIGPMLAVCVIFLTGRGICNLYRRESRPWVAWIAIWIVFIGALFLVGWFGITIFTSFGASDYPVAIFLRWTALMAAGLTTLAQPLVILWLYIASRAVRRLQACERPQRSGEQVRLEIFKV